MKAQAAGFALLEVLAATAIVLILAGSLLAVTLPTHAGFAREPAANDVQDRVRTAAQSLRQELLEAGSGPAAPSGGLPLGLLVPPVLPYRIGLRRADPPGTFRHDLITVVSSSPGAAATTIAADFQGSVGIVTVNTPPGCPLGHPSCGLEPGMGVLLLDQSGQADYYGVSAAVGNLVTLAARGPATGRRYAAGARLVPIDVSTYYIRPSAGSDGPQLARYDGNASDLPFVDHLVELAVEYYGDPQPPRLRVQAGALGEAMTYGPTPPPVGEDDERDSWGAGENCVVSAAGAPRAPRMPELGAAASSLQHLAPDSLTDGPWCPDAEAVNRFDADLLRVRRVRVTLRVEAWLDAMRGRDPRLFSRPGHSPGGGRLVPDERIVFDVVLRAPGGSR